MTGSCFREKSFLKLYLRFRFLIRTGMAEKVFQVSQIMGAISSSAIERVVSAFQVMI